MKDNNEVYFEVIAIIAFTMMLILNAFLATQKYQNKFQSRSHYETKRN